MNAEFVRQHAPDIDLPYNGSWITPEPEAGLQAPENLYGSDGMPLNYIQDAGGPRQFYAPSGTTPTAEGPVQGLRGRASPTPAPMPLRGLSNPNATTNDIPIMPRPTPTPVQGLRGRTSPDAGLAADNLMQRTPSRSTSPRPRPGSTVVPQEQWTTRGERQGTMTRVGPQGTSPSGMMEELGISRRQSTSTASTAQPEDNHPLRGIGGQLTENPNGTLADMLQSLGINIQLPQRRPSGTQETTGLSPESLGLPTIDVQADLVSNPSRGGRVTRTSAGAPGNNGNWAGRATDIARTLSDSGRVRVTSAFRTNNAVAGGHGSGNSIDISPDSIDAAREIIARQYPGMPVEYIYVRRGQQFGNGVVATGDHYHIDIGPAASGHRHR